MRCEGPNSQILAMSDPSLRALLEEKALGSRMVPVDV